MGHSSATPSPSCPPAAPTNGHQLRQEADVQHKRQRRRHGPRGDGGPHRRARALADLCQRRRQQALAPQHHQQTRLAQQAGHGAGDDACRVHVCAGRCMHRM